MGASSWALYEQGWACLKGTALRVHSASAWEAFPVFPSVTYIDTLLEDNHMKTIDVSDRIHEMWAVVARRHGLRVPRDLDLPLHWHARIHYFLETYKSKACPLKYLK